jgi:hypothetical protein
VPCFCAPVKVHLHCAASILPLNYWSWCWCCQVGAFKAGIVKKLGADHPLAAQLSELQQDLTTWSAKAGPEHAGGWTDS